MDERIVPTMCHGCSYGGYNCGILAHTVGEKFTKVEGNPAHPLNEGKLCAKGLSAVQWVYNTKRLRYPLQRIGRKGEGRFRRISWEAALDIVAKRLAEARCRHGAESIVLAKGQASSWGGLHHFLWMRFMNALGSPNMSNWGPYVCYGPQLMYHKLTIGGPTYAMPDYDGAELIIEWFTGGGTGGAARGGVETLDTNLRTVPFKILDRLDQGARLVIINPQLIPLGANGRVSRWLAPRPGTDAALALAMIHVIIAEEIYDSDFVTRWCEGFEALREHVRPYTPSWAEGVTGISAPQIEDLAREYATTPRACIRVTESPEKEGLQAFATAIPILMALTGHLGGPGANRYFTPERRLGFDILRKRLPGGTAEKILGAGNFYTEHGRRMTADFIAIVDALVTGRPYRPRALLFFGSNPLSTARNPALVATALEGAEFTAVIDLFLTPTARYADIVLPAATRYECEGEPALWNGHLAMTRRVVEPLWESRDEIQVTLDLAVRLGMGKDFWEGKYAAMANDFLGPAGVGLDELRKSGPRGIRVGAERPGAGRERLERDLGKLPGGKIQLFNRTLGEKGFDPLPVYRGEPEDPVNTPGLLEEFPFIFTDEHSTYTNQHSWMGSVGWLREIRRLPYVKINPATAAGIGVTEGDWVELASPHGRMRAVVLYCETLRPDTLMGIHGWWQGCENPGSEEYPQLEGGVNPNVLYNWEKRDRATGNLTKNTLVNIRKTTPPGGVVQPGEET